MIHLCQGKYMLLFWFCLTEKKVEHLLSFPKCKIDQNDIINFYSIFEIEELLKCVARTSLRCIK